MAGNIIPAIATTNAIVAGLIVMEALKVLRGRFDQCRMVSLTLSVAGVGSLGLELWLGCVGSLSAPEGALLLAPTPPHQGDYHC